MKNKIYKFGILPVKILIIIILLCLVNTFAQLYSDGIYLTL